MGVEDEEQRGEHTSLAPVLIVRMLDRIFPSLTCRLLSVRTFTINLGSSEQRTFWTTVLNVELKFTNRSLRSVATALKRFKSKSSMALGSIFVSFAGNQSLVHHRS